VAECCKVTLGGCVADAGTKMTDFNFDMRGLKQPLLFVCNNLLKEKVKHQQQVNSHIAVHTCRRKKQGDKMYAAD